MTSDQYDFIRALDGSWVSPHHVIRVRRAHDTEGTRGRIEADLVDGSVAVLSETGDLRKDVNFLDIAERQWLEILSTYRTELPEMP